LETAEPRLGGLAGNRQSFTGGGLGKRETPKASHLLLARAALALLGRVDRGLLGAWARAALAYTAGFTLYMVTIIEIYSVNPACITARTAPRYTGNPCGWYGWRGWQSMAVESGCSRGHSRASHGGGARGEGCSGESRAEPSRASSRDRSAGRRRSRGGVARTGSGRGKRAVGKQGRGGLRAGFEQFEPKIHRVDPESGSTRRLLQGFSVKLPGQLANFGSTL
jgi:hypothetical protein